MELLERSAALDQLEAGLRDAAAGRGRLIAITGPAGIGKTALIRTFVRERASGARILWGACDDLVVPRPLGPLVDISSAFEDELRGALAGETDSRRLFALVIRELERRPRPTVLVLDDLQWVDQATLDLLIYAARRLDRLPVLLVVSSRHESAAAAGLRRLLVAGPTDRTTRTELAPLSLDAVAALVGERSAEVHARTGGVPFYVRALQGHDDDTVPATVRDVVLAQVDVLPDETRNLLELLAMDPSGVRPAELDVVSPDWERHASAAEQASLVVHSGTVVAFAHELAREAVRETLPAVRRRELHRRLLAALPHDADATRIVHHAEVAGDTARLVPASLSAARAARSVHAHQQALDHYQRLAPHLDRLEDPVVRAAVAEEHAEELLAAGELERAIGALELAIRRRGELGDERERGRLLARRASYLAQLGRHAEELDSLEVALGVLEPIEPGVELCHAYVYRASHHLDGWDVSAAQRFAGRGLELADAIGAEDLRAYAMMMLGAAQAAGEEPDAGFVALEDAVALAGVIGHPGLVDAARSELIDACLDGHRLDAAETELEQALAHAEVHQHHGIHARLTMQRSRLLLHRGDLHGALAAADGAIEAAGASPLVHWQARVQAAWALTRLGDPAAAAAVEDVGRVAEHLAVRFRVRFVVLEAEFAWLHGRRIDLRALSDVHRRALGTGLTWAIDDLTGWLRRHVSPAGDAALDLDDLSESSRAVLQGDRAAASTAGPAGADPYERAMAGYDSSRIDEVSEALEVADGLDARPLGELLRGRLRALGVRRVPRGPLPTTRSNPAGLTDRQIEVLAWLAEGLTNAEIAHELVLSKRTVDHHVSAVLGKLGVSSRREAALRARSLGLSGRAIAD
jgi:ATP/maltotriose-dependent transcriptional regulator MalT